MDRMRSHIMVCGGTGCTSPESEVLIDALKSELEKVDYEKEVNVIRTGCFGLCDQGHVVKMYPDNIHYVNVKKEDARDIVNEHIVKGRPVSRLMYVAPEEKKNENKKDQTGFSKKQYRIALRNCGLIDPDDIYDYIAFRGYEGLARVLEEKTPSEVTEIVKQAGLRGRGGGGFPTGMKWKFTLRSPGNEKYIICNADEGDPGAFMDRSILEGDPHSVIEAMAIGGYATGANTGIVYIRAEYPLAIKRLQKAITQARELGLLGKNIFNSQFDFDIEVKLGAGAFVCGEETALIQSVEGSRGEPMKKPPFPSESGYLGKPTTVNNVETLANIPSIILNGADWFSGIGTESSKGTKVFALAGNVKNVGLVEVPMGTTLREIIFDIGGGIRGDKEFKAVQTGGPSGGVITSADLDTPIDYESLKKIGSIMGSGGMIVMDEDTCMVNISKFFLEFTQDESCGKCTPCRVGTKRMHEILDKITKGQGSEEDLDLLEELAPMIKDSALCGLGQTAPNPVLSTLHYYRNEYEDHVIHKRCTANACEAWNKYYIDPGKCIGCSLCAKACPVHCIAGAAKEIHVVDSAKCISCGICFRACKFDAVIKPMER